MHRLNCENCFTEHDGTYGSGRFCSATCARGFSTKEKRNEINKKVSKTLTKPKYKLICVICTTSFEAKNQDKKTCSRSCSVKLKHKMGNYKNITGEGIKAKQSESRTKYWSKKFLKENSSTSIDYKTCLFCQKLFVVNIYRKKKRFCNQSCAKKYNNKYGDGLIHSRKGGLNSVHSQSCIRRSKNEIYFSELCIEYFAGDIVLSNEPIFNGWDADIIIPHLKLAILWNGIWHYKQIGERHSLKKVQNRDCIKISEIKKLGYIPYIIKDLGSENKRFVKQEFEKFKTYISAMT